MATVRADVAARFEFLEVVLADPELLDLAFAEVIASWESEPPRPPKRTLVGTSDGRYSRSGIRGVNHDCQHWHEWVRVIPRPIVARSPPEHSVASHL
jgi:hypothetical protein